MIIEQQKKTPFEDAYPLSRMQSGIYLHAEQGVGDAVYHDIFSLRVECQWHEQVFYHAVQQVIARHPVLRTSFEFEKFNQPLQLVHHEGIVRLNFRDASEVSDTESFLQRLHLELQNSPFDLAKPSQIRFTVVQLNDKQLHIYVDAHHIILDGWSMASILSDVFGGYLTQLQGGSLSQISGSLNATFKQFIKAELQSLADGNAQEYWDKKLSEIEVQQFQQHDIGVTSQTLSRRHQFAELTLAAQQLTKQQKVSLKEICMAVHLRVLSFIKGQHSVTSTYVSNGRLESAGGDTAAGLFLNLLPLTANLSDLSWENLIAHIAAEQQQAMPYRRFPFSEMVGRAGQSISDVHFNFVHFHVYKQLQGREDFRVLSAEIQEKNEIPLSCTFHLNSAGELELLLRHDTAYISEQRAEQYTSYYQAAFEQLVKDPSSLVTSSDLLLQRANEYAQVLSGKTSEQQLSVVGRILRQATLTPGAIAVRTEQKSCSYRDLLQKAMSVRAQLLKEKQADGAFVGLDISPGSDLLGAMLGCHLASAAYVIIEHQDGKDNIAHILQKANIACVFSDQDYWLTENHHSVTVLNAENIELNTLNARDKPVLPDLESSAYAVFTSGTTGRPKGVDISHQALNDYCEFAFDEYYQQQLQGSLVITRPRFDISVPSLFLPLMTGGIVVFANPQDPLCSAADFLQREKQQSYLLRMTPGHLQGLLALMESRIVAERHLFVVGGEHFEFCIYEQTKQTFPRSTIYNHYGPSEATVGCCLINLAELPDNTRNLPIGRAMNNVEFMVVDEAQKMVPPGTQGELLISGVGLAKGYLGDEQKTAQKFLRIGNQQKRFFRSGDLVSYTEDGLLTFIGRRDNQINFNGYRIEPGQINQILIGHNGVVKAHTALQGEGINRFLVSFVQIAEAHIGVISGFELLQWLKPLLPDYMVPAHLAILPEFPLTAAGKVNVRAFPNVSLSDNRRPLEAPVGEIETSLAEIWQEVLKTDKVGRQDDFFDIGGQSISAIKVVTLINKQMHVKVTIRDLFEYRTPKGLAAHIAGLTHSEHQNIPLQSRATPLALSFSQQRLWFIDRLNPGDSHYNMPAVLRLDGQLNHEALNGALNDIVQRHEILRTVYHSDADGKAIQMIFDDLEISVPVNNISHLQGDDQQQSLEVCVAKAVSVPFNLEQDAMLRAELLQLSSESYALLFSMHHIASDGWSMGILVQEFCKAYSARVNHKPLALPELRIQYADYAMWQRSWLDSQEAQTAKNWWCEQLADLPAVHSLPLDGKRQEKQTGNGKRFHQNINASLTESLNSMAQQADASLFMLLESSFALLISRYSNSADVVIGTPVANRDHADLGDLIGFFVNTLVLRHRIADNLTFNEYLLNSRDMILQAYANQHVPFELLVDELQPKRSLSYTPLFQVMFAVQIENHGNKLELPGLNTVVQEADSGLNKFDITIRVFPEESGLNIHWHYNDDLFNSNSIVQMAEAWQNLLLTIVDTPDTRVDEFNFMSGPLPVASLLAVKKASDLHKAFEQAQAGQVVNDSGSRQPAGAPGELQLQDQNGQWQSTGRWVRMHSAGQVLDLGAKDKQVCLQGVNCNLSEAENVLASIAELADFSLTVEEHRQRPVLVLRVQPKETPAYENMFRDMLHHTLTLSLPFYQVPEAIAVAKSADSDSGDDPLNHAKLHWFNELEFLPPESPIEVALAKMWCELLDLKQVSLNDNFFRCGGNSLTCVRLEFAVKDKLERDLSVRDIFSHSTLKELAALLESRSENAQESIAIQPRTGPLALSFAQQRLWFIDRLEPGSSQYNMPVALRLEGEIDYEALRAAMNDIVTRHEVLRTVYHSDAEGQAIQVIRDGVEVDLPLEDISRLAGDEQDAELHRLLREAALAPFVLATDTMLRASLVKLSDDTHVLLFNMHHIASDGWSIGVLVQEFSQAYGARFRGQSLPFAPLAIQYADYAVWQREWLDSEAAQASKAWWCEQLADLPPVHSLPLDGVRPARQTFTGGAFRQSLDRGLSEALNGLARDYNATLFMLLESAFALLIGRYSHEQDVAIGTPVANREHSDLSGLIGFFVNTLVLRHRFDDNPTFADYLVRNREMILSAYGHQQMPFELLVEALQPSRSLSHTPLFQVMFALQNNEQQRLELPGLTVSAQEGDADMMAKFDLTVSVTETDAGLLVGWNYNSDLFSEQSVAQMAQAWECLLSALVASPETPVMALPLVNEQTRQGLLQGALRGPALEYERDHAVHCQVAEQAVLTPNAVAVSDNARSLTYRQLHEQASRLAYRLADGGVAPGDLVGVAVPRSVDMMVAVLAVLHAGGAYVPLDMSLPLPRRTHMLRDADVRHLVVSEAGQASVADMLTDEMRVHEVTYLNEGEGLSVPRGSEETAYVIYTSGSTGQPKGVMVSHGNLLHYLAYTRTRYISNAGALQGGVVSTPLSFDATVTTLFTPLLQGGQVHLVSDDVQAMVIELIALMRSDQRWLFKLTPAHLSLVSQTLSPDSPLSMTPHMLVLGGDVLEQSVVSCWLEAYLPESVWVNEYGPTETTVGCSTFLADKRQAWLTSVAVPVGRAISNTQLYILDSEQQLCPPGASGELHIGGDGVATGYLNNDTLTEEKFIANPFGSGRLYRSGDLVRLDNAGELQFIGRADEQVKLRGFRIETGEIEQAITAINGISDAVALIHDINSVKQLVAFYVTEKNDISTKFLHIKLKNSLPGHMIPNYFVTVDKIPLTANGKRDKAALIKILPETFASEDFELPQTEAERVLVDVWSKVLGVDSVSINDNYFVRGGDSIKAVQVIKQASDHEVYISVQDVFRHQTIKELALAAGMHNREAALALRPADLSLLYQDLDTDAYLSDDYEDCYPVTSMQQTMLDEYGVNGLEYGIYHPQSLFNINGVEIDIARFEKILNMLVTKHHALRTQFVRLNGGNYLQRIYKQATVKVEYHDFTSLSERQVTKSVASLSETDFDLPFSETPLQIRTKLIRYEHQQWGVFISTHHAILDGWGFVELLNELADIYFSETATEALTALKPIANVHKEHVALELETVNSALYREQWDDLLANYKPMPALQPIRRPKLKQASLLPIGIGSNDVAMLMSLAEKLTIPLKAVLLSALNMALAELWKIDTVTVDVVSNGRSVRLSDPTGSIGMFWNQLPIVWEKEASVDKIKGLKTLAETIQKTDAVAQYPKKHIMELLGNKSPTNVCFNFVNFHNLEKSKENKLDSRPGMSSDRFHHHVKMVLSLDEATQRLGGELEYNKGYMTHKQAKKLLSLWQAALKSLVL